MVTATESHDGTAVRGAIYWNGEQDLESSQLKKTFFSIYSIAVFLEYLMYF